MGRSPRPNGNIRIPKVLDGIFQGGIPVGSQHEEEIQIVAEYKDKGEEGMGI
jgi:hypothetical protein